MTHMKGTEIKQKKKIIVTLMTFLLLGGLFLAEQLGFSINGLWQPEKEVVTLVRPVAGGDTANFATLSYGNVNVRFSGVDTPETKHPTKGIEPYGKEASDFTKEKLENAKVIEIEWDTTQGETHNRPVDIIFIDGINLNLRLVGKVTLILNT